MTRLPLRAHDLRQLANGIGAAGVKGLLQRDFELRMVRLNMHRFQGTFDVSALQSAYDAREDGRDLISAIASRKAAARRRFKQPE